MENPLIIKILSPFSLRYIFSHLEYNRFISLIKYSKNIQKDLNINLKNNINHNKYIEREVKNSIPNDSFEGIGGFFAGLNITAIYLYFFIHYIINRIVEIKLNSNYDKYENKEM